MCPLAGIGDYEHFVYRCYDAEDRLLYIGCTGDLVSRIQTHRSCWNNRASVYLAMYMARFTAESHPNRAAAMRAEAEAIKAEAPLLNTIHNEGRSNWPEEPAKVDGDSGAELARTLAAFSRRTGRSA